MLAHSTSSVNAQAQDREDLVATTQGDKARLIVFADMGWDPDEEQQMTHLLMCSNEFELEGLVTVTGRFLRKNPPQKVKTLKPELFYQLLEGYEKVYPNLLKHGEGWHTPEYLRSIVATGQPGNGMEDVGEGKSSPGSELVIALDLETGSSPRTHCGQCRLQHSCSGAV